MILWVDFETRSRCDLPRAGVYNYARDPSTEVLCMSYAFGLDDVKTWVPGQPFPERVSKHKGQIRAHNAAFERLIFKHVLQTNFDLSQFYCTAAQARANCAPGGLEDVGRFASSKMKKDYRGAQLIRMLCVPMPGGEFRESEQLTREMIEYCEQDVRAMRAISNAMRDLSSDELRDYHINERINDYGARVDVDLCRAAIGYAHAELIEIEKIVSEVTKGHVASVRSPNMRKWVMDRVGPQARELMLVEKGGEIKPSIDKTVRANLLVLAEENPDEVPADVAEVIQCADDLWASSVAKFNRLHELADESHRLRGAFVFAGGSATGRASSFGAQVHNFTRKVAKSPDEIRTAMTRGHKIIPKFGARVTDVLKGMLRPAIIPSPGRVLVVGDWSAIEARMNPWLSGHADAETKLDLFRRDEDVYKHNAVKTFNVPLEDVTDDERQVGKVQELACGYGGGIGAFESMARIYGVKMPRATAQRMVDAWRRANQWAVEYWSDLESAYTRAMRNPGHEFHAGRVVYLFDGLHLWYALPSGRVLCYPYARLEPDGVSYAKAAWKPKADASEWPRARLWRGLACENITQAAANDVLRHALRVASERTDLDVILHVHDEIVAEADEENADAARATLLEIMKTVPVWASGLPLDAKVKTMTRYGK